VEKIEFFKVLNEQKENEIKDRRIDEQKRNAFMGHKNELLLQIQSNSDGKK